MEGKSNDSLPETIPSSPGAIPSKSVYDAAQSFLYEDAARSYASSWSYGNTRPKLAQDFPGDLSVAHSQYLDSRIDELKNEIRLVRLAAGEDSYEMVVVSLKQAPEYAALSYAWGDSFQSTSITLNGTQIQVGANLGAALKQLSSTERFLWVDAICINQSDSEERSAQVSKMREIYTRARRVRVWLGKGNEGSDLVFSLLYDIHSKGDDGEHLNRLYRDEEESFEVLQAIQSLFDLEYWWRVWVIQEVNVARDVTVHCGSCTMSWADMIAAQQVLRDKCGALFYELSKEYPYLVDLFQSVNFRGPRSLQLNQHAWNRSGRDMGLFEVLMGHRLKHSTDPRDKIFALVGLTSARNDPEFIIDYSLSDSQVFINAVKYVIRKSGKLDIILIKPEKLGDGQQSPSWVPDWSVNYSRTYKTYRHASPHSAYNASAVRESHAATSTQNDILQAKGLVIGSLAALYSISSMTELHDDASALRDIYTWYTWFLDQRGDEIEAETVQHFVRLLLCELTKAKDSLEESQPEFLTSILASIARHGQETYPDLPAPPMFAALANIVEPDDPGVYAWIRAIAPSLYKRRPFVTSSGAMGLAAGTICEGDAACVLFGCTIPVVLRKDRENYVFVSDACVVDYMFGRAIEELEEGKYQEQLFEIR